MTDGPLAGVRLLYVVNVDWFFLSHRLPIARAARAAGAQVLVATAGTGRAADIEREGFTLIELPFTRNGAHPWRELRTCLALLRVYRRVRPHVIHHVTVKPVLYGSLIARAGSRRAAVVNAISGLGFSFSEDRRARHIGRVVRMLYRAALRHPRSRTIFQNPDDLGRFVDAGLIAPDRAVLIPGSGVDCTVFAPAAHQGDHPPTVLMSSRLLWEKGTGDFAQAAGIVRAQRADVRFLLAGSPDEGNVTSVGAEDLERWVASGALEWLGHVTHMPDLLRRTDVYCLPTYYPEGVPKALLEAAATECALIATDVPGCRDVVIDGRTGVLVRPKDPAALAAAILGLLDAPGTAAELGRAAREHVRERFSEDVVVRRTLDLYEQVLRR